MNGFNPTNSDSYIKSIMNCIRDKVCIPDDLLDVFCESTFEIVQNRSYNAITPKTRELCLLLSHLWSSQIYANMSDNPILIFQIGELHACSSMLDKLYSEKKADDNISINSIRYKDKISFFRTIKDNPGIRQIDLSKITNISKSSISQFAAKIKSYGYHYERISGREKYYYLTATGLLLLERMEMNIKKKDPVPTRFVVETDFFPQIGKKDIVINISKFPASDFNLDIPLQKPTISNTQLPDIEIPAITETEYEEKEKWDTDQASSSTRNSNAQSLFA